MASLEEQLARMTRTADELAAVIKGVSDAMLSKRPDEKSWSAKEALCHLRDTEESFMQRFQSIMEMDEPRFSPPIPTAGPSSGSTSATTRARPCSTSARGATRP